MSGFLDRISTRTVGEAPRLSPRPRSLFEPDPVPVDVGERLAEVTNHVEAGAVSAMPMVPQRSADATPTTRPSNDAVVTPPLGSSTVHADAPRTAPGLAEPGRSAPLASPVFSAPLASSVFSATRASAVPRAKPEPSSPTPVSASAPAAPGAVGPAADAQGATTIASQVELPKAPDASERHRTGPNVHARSAVGPARRKPPPLAASSEVDTADRPRHIEVPVASAAQSEYRRVEPHTPFELPRKPNPGPIVRTIAEAAPPEPPIVEVRIGPTRAQSTRTRAIFYAAPRRDFTRRLSRRRQVAMSRT